MQSVYIETTVPSFYFETRKSPLVLAWQAATRMWWDQYRARYRLCVSRFVMEELSRAPAAKARQALRLVRDCEVLSEPPELTELVQYYIEQHLMPVEAGGDAFHLALASLQAVDFMLTWNCRHLANANKTRHLAVLNGRLGLHVPIITTPLTLIPEDAP
jgi:hypothetical protein